MADQIMAGQNRKLLLYGFIIILGLLQGSAAYNICCSPVVPIQILSDSCTSEYYFFQVHTCVDSILALVFVLVDLVPLIIYFPLLILFNVNLVSGLAQSFIFFYQTLPAAVPIRPFSASTFIGRFLWGFLTMQSPIDVLIPVLPYIVLHYCKLAAVLVAIVMTVVLVKCVDCPCTSWRRPWAKLRRCVRHFREKRAYKGTVLNGLCSIAILTYGFVIEQSFSILQPTQNCSNGTTLCAYYCTELNYAVFDTDYSPYLFVALIVLVLVLPLPLLLLYYPCVPALMQRVTKRSPQFLTCHKLAPVFDVFQSAYKPKLRCCAAFPLLYRFVIWLLFCTLSVLSQPSRQFFITLAFIVILAIHSLVQPYRKPKHNYIEALYLINLVLISTIFTVPLAIIGLSPNNDSRNECNRILITIISNLPTFLAYLPGLVVIGHFIWKRNCCKRCRAACCKGDKRNRRGVAQSEVVRVSLSEVYFAMSEEEQINED